MAKKTKDLEKTVSDTAKLLLDKLQVEASVIVTKEGEDSFKVKIDTQDTGLLIGYHGEVVNSLQLILGVIVYRQIGTWTRIIVDVGDYREKREETVKKMALDKAAEVQETGQSVSLPYLSPLERRIVHMTLSDNPNVTSQSEGEGKDRHVVIKPR